jgi:acyl carrier protein
MAASTAPRRPGDDLLAFRSRTLPDPETTIRAVITTLLERRGATDVEVSHGSKLTEDLGLDSLELAELSAALEDDLGRDPYTEGTVPQTLGDLVGFYGA